MESTGLPLVGSNDNDILNNLFLSAISRLTTIGKTRIATGEMWLVVHYMHMDTCT